MPIETTGPTPGRPLTDDERAELWSLAEQRDRVTLGTLKAELDALAERIKADAYQQGRTDALTKAADLLNQERAAHLIASTRAPAAGPLFRVEQRLLSLAADSAPSEDQP